MDWTLGLFPQHLAPPATVRLERGCTLRLTRARGRRIACRHGCLWITAAGCQDDIFLRAGEGWTVPVAGLVVVEADGVAAIVGLDFLNPPADASGSQRSQSGRCTTPQP